MSGLTRSSAVRVVALAAVGYLALACLLTWPLPARLTTHLTGLPTGDTGVYVWNIWVFGQELLQNHRLPFSTDYVFADSGGTDFSFHNFTPLAGLIATPLLGWLGIVGGFNVVLLLAIVTSALGAFALGRQLGLSGRGAWVGGAMFVAAPAFIARDTAHISLVTAAPVPAFAAMLLRTLERRRTADAVFAGLFVAIAAYCDVYYGVYAVMIGLFLVGARFLRLDRLGAGSPALRRGLVAGMAVFAAAALWSAAGGPPVVQAGPIRLQLDSAYNPMLFLVLLAGLRIWLVARPVPRVHNPEGLLPEYLRLGAVSVAACLVALLPLIVGMALSYADGAQPNVPIFWRSSPRGVDLLAYFAPNPMHAWFGERTRAWLLPEGTGSFPEFTAAFPLTAWALIAFAAWRGALPRRWIAFTAFFMLLSLGPFAHVGGINTQTVTPWAFLRYVPVVGLARAPARFSIVAILGLSLLTAFAAERRLSAVRAGWRTWAIAAVLMFELWPAPRTLYSAAVPQVYEMVAASKPNPEGRLLELPTGIRDGVSSIGDFNASTQFFQTRHRRPVVGGYLSRVSERRKEEGRRAPVLRVLFHLSEGKSSVPPEWLENARAARTRFLARTCVRYVVVDKQRASAELRKTATDLLDLVSVHEDDRYELLWPMNPPACDPRPRRAGVLASIESMLGVQQP